MASDTHTGKKGNESSSAKDERTDIPSSVNTFANDGSFLELFKKRMEKESQKLQNKGQAVDEDDSENKVGAREEKQPDRKALGSTKTLTQQVWLSQEKNSKVFLLGKDRANMMKLILIPADLIM